MAAPLVLRDGVLVATVQEPISTPGGIQQANIHVTGQLKKAVDLTPFSQQPGWDAMIAEMAADPRVQAAVDALGMSAQIGARLAGRSQGQLRGWGWRGRSPAPIRR